MFRVGKGLKAMSILINKVNKFKLNPRVSLQLFDEFCWLNTTPAQCGD